MIYVYSDGTKFIKIDKNMKLSITKDINKASIWFNKKDAISWNKWIISKKQTMELKEASLTLK